MRTFLKKYNFLIFLGLFHSLLINQTWGQTITTVVGNCTAGYTGDGGPATLATLDGPDDIAFDSNGNYYIADAGSNTVREVNISTGIIFTYAGLYNPLGLPLAGDGGPATAAYMNFPSAIAFDPSNNLYIADFYNSVIRVVNAATGIITTFGGNGTYGYSGDGGPVLLAEMGNPNVVRFSPSGLLYLSDAGNDTIRAINMSTGIISTVAGNGTAGYSGDGGPATLAELNQPEAMTFDSSGNLYLSDTVNSVIREVNAATGIISTVVGTGVDGFSGDGGPATLAGLSDDIGSVTIACNGELLLTDDFDNRVRMVDKTTDIINTVIGTGVSGCSTSGTPLLTTNISHPESLAFDSHGNLYLVDYDYSLVQFVTGLCPGTPTSSATTTPTHTVTSTATTSPTFTMTFTPTNSATFTPTYTPTNTETISPTFTPTHSATNSSTFTNTWTPTLTHTLTPTSSPTSSPTFTASSTPTVTFTPTGSIFMGKQVSETQAQSGDTLTYTISVTLSGNSLNNVVITDTLPANVVYVSMGSPIAGTATFYSNSYQINWTLPPTLTPGQYTLSYKTQVDPFTPAGTNIVNSAQLTFPGLESSLTSSVTVEVTGQYSVKVGVYNEAGELINPIRVIQLSQFVNNLNLQGNSITSLVGANGRIYIYSQGYLLGVWDGTGSDGVPVTNGVYFIKVNSTDAHGVVSTITQPATVSRNLAKVSLNIYNEAGEIIKHLLAWVDDPLGTQMTNVVLTSSVLQPGGPASGSQPSIIEIEVQTSGSAVTLSWDGTNDDGAYVTAGKYLLGAYWFDGQGEISNISKDILVTANVNRSPGTLVAKPNILTFSSGVTRTTLTILSTQNLTLRIKIYTLAGELAAEFQGTAGSNQATWDATGYASGLYLMAVDLLNLNGGKVDQQILKIVVLR